jgi:hypothetical protein
MNNGLGGMMIRRGDYGAKDDWPIAFPCHGVSERVGGTERLRGHVYEVYGAFPNQGTNGTRPEIGFLTLGEIRARFGDSVTLNTSGSVCPDCYNDIGRATTLSIAAEPPAETT